MIRKRAVIEKVLQDLARTKESIRRRYINLTVPICPSTSPPCDTVSDRDRMLKVHLHQPISRISTDNTGCAEISGQKKTRGVAKSQDSSRRAVCEFVQIQPQPTHFTPLIK